MDLLRPFKGGWASAAAAAAAPAPTSASVDTALIRERFNFDWATSEPVDDLDTYWWWARSIRVDPNEVIADDGEGQIWSVPFTTDGTDAVTFGQPVRVAETYVPVEAGEGQAATAAVQRRRQRVAASALDRPDKPDRPNQPTTAAESAGEEERPMTDEQRRALALSLGLAEDATEQDIHAHATEANATPDEPDGEPGTPENTTDVTPEPVLVAASATPGTPNVRDILGLPATATDADVARAASEMRAGAQAGARVARQAQASELDGLVDQAVRDGRIAPSARDAWRQAIDPGENPDTAASARATAERDRLAAMAAGRVPVTERGGAPSAGSRPASLGRALAASGINQTSRRSGQQEVIHRG